MKKLLLIVFIFGALIALIAPTYVGAQVFVRPLDWSICQSVPISQQPIGCEGFNVRLRMIAEKYPRLAQGVADAFREMGGAPSWGGYKTLKGGHFAGAPDLVLDTYGYDNVASASYDPVNKVLIVDSHNGSLNCQPVGATADLPPSNDVAFVDGRLVILTGPIIFDPTPGKSTIKILSSHGNNVCSASANQLPLFTSSFE